MQVSNLSVHVLHIVLIITEVLIVFLVPIFIILSILSERQARNAAVVSVERRRLEESRHSLLPQAGMSVKIDYLS